MSCKVKTKDDWVKYISFELGMNKTNSNAYSDIQPSVGSDYFF